MTYGVALLETSFVIFGTSVFLKLAVIKVSTYNINSTIPSNSNDRIEGPEIYTDD
jgi:hypothetical protein